METYELRNDSLPNHQDLKALETFLVGNKDLDRLATLLDRFNILEALGVVRQELTPVDLKLCGIQRPHLEMQTAAGKRRGMQQQRPNNVIAWMSVS
jgi:hypothetical protein